MPWSGAPRQQPGPVPPDHPPTSCQVRTYVPPAASVNIKEFGVEVVVTEPPEVDTMLACMEKSQSTAEEAAQLGKHGPEITSVVQVAVAT